MITSLLFVYGTLRPAFDGPMAAWLQSVARHVGPASAAGMLYHVADYPGFVPGTRGMVAGDLFEIDDPVLSILDQHEECAEQFPKPWEYMRQRLTVQGPHGPVEAWTYAYARDVTHLAAVAHGDFLA